MQITQSSQLLLLPLPFTPIPSRIIIPPLPLPPPPSERMPRPADSVAQAKSVTNGELKPKREEKVEEDRDHILEAHRPPAIEEDLWEMGRRKRVKEVLGAEDFRNELEQVVRPEFAKSFPEDLNSAALQAIALPRMANFAQLPPLPGLNVNQFLNNPPIPIADLPRASQQYSAEERRFRNKLATIYRLADLFHWSQGIYNHITLRLPGPGPCQILINPFGLLYHEITASSLVKLSLEGDVLDQGSTNLGVNQAAYVLHSAIHEARPDVHCVLHLHTAVVAAIGSMKCGLLPICQEAMIIGPVAYHDYQGILTDEEEKRSIVRDLGDKNVMILRNHGFVACGQTVEDALHLAFHTIIACETQILILREQASFICCGGSAEEVVWITHQLVDSCQNQIRAARAGLDNLNVPSEEAVQKAYLTARRGGGGVNRKQEENGAKTNTASLSWGIGELEWEAWCRALDTAGYSTGHIYRNPQLRQPLPAQSHHSMYNLASVATPPASIGTVEESEATVAWRQSMLRKEKERAKWLNSPCQYQKVQLLETGTFHPRLVTKWVEQNGCSASASSGGTPVKINSPHQFSPCNGPDSREFRERQRRLKEVRLSGTTSPGPKSQVLEGIGMEETNGQAKSAMNRPIYIGTASKGIIQRDQQINAQVYRQLYAPNPFRGESEQDLKQYLRDVEEKTSNGRPPALAMNGRVISSLPGSPQHQMPESPTTDTASLMQAVKRVKLNGRSASGEGEGPGEAGNGRANGKGRDGKDVQQEERGKEKEVEPGGKRKKRRGIFFFSRKKSS